MSDEAIAGGIVRHFDDVGRISIPVELRKKYHLASRSPVEIVDDGKNIIIRPYMGDRCIFCACTKNVRMFKGKPVCAVCIPDKNKK